MTVILNFFGGPGVGKSTLAAELFTRLKYDQFDVEIAPEYAKDLTWEKRLETLKFQPYVIAKQQYRIHRLIGQVDIIVTDSPTVLGCIYGQGHGYHKETFDKFVVESFKQWNNLNFLLRRGFPYKEKGRNQTEEEAKIIDDELYRFLHRYGIPYLPVVVDNETPNVIYTYVLERLQRQSREAGTRA